MKKNSISAFVFAVLSAICIQTISAQFPTSIPEIPKIPKTEKPNVEQPTATTNDDD